MPTPSKFTRDRQARIVELLSAGVSRRQASAAAGISPKTLRRWLERGERASRIAPGSSSATFYEAVTLAEQGDPILVELRRQYEEASPAWLRRFIEPEFDLWRVQDKVTEPSDFPEPEPFEVEVRLSDGHPFDRRPVHDPAERSPA